MTKTAPLIDKGTQVVVYDDPITCMKSEGRAVVTKVIRREDWSDSEGRAIVRCNVRFMNSRVTGDRSVYERDVSVIAA